MRAEKLWLLGLLASVGGCPDRTIAAVSVDQTRVEEKDFPATLRRDVDILFLIDDSGSMKEEQDSLKANFHRFISVLESIDGGLPSVHIGVTSSDLGTSAIDGSHGQAVGSCVGDGKAGALRAVPGGGPRFLSDLDDGHGGRTRNYTGALTDVFAQIADVGIAGCGIEQHLEAMKRALDRTNTANAGFLRDDAYLAVIVIADEDDCSLAKGALFDGNPGDPGYGDRVNFRCTQEGVECDSPGTPLDQVGVRHDCHPRYDSTLVTQTDRYVQFLKTLKADPRDVVVAGIVGDEGPFTIKSKNGQPILDHSCQYAGPTETQFAFPAIRTGDFLTQFPGRNTRTTICNSDLSSGLVQVAELLKEVVGNRCFTNQPVDADPDAPGPQYDCTVTEVRHVANLPDADLRVLPQCDPARATFPCWHIDEDAEHCSYTAIDPHLALFIERGSENPPEDVHIKASCVTKGSSSSFQ